jgi:hypothetical protein
LLPLNLLFPRREHTGFIAATTSRSGARAHIGAAQLAITLTDTTERRPPVLGKMLDSCYPGITGYRAPQKRTHMPR